MGRPFGGKNGIGMFEAQFATGWCGILGVAEERQGFESSFGNVGVDLGIIIEDLQEARKGPFANVLLAIAGEALE
jgi:hypothetical protein